jgi:hypothetical protein
MTGSATATVETLTAEVHVLMVGKRQVTLSVYRQLDHVSPDEIVPFGRVRADRKLHESSVEVVGTTVEGQLVASSIEKPWWRERDTPKSFHHWASHHLKVSDSPNLDGGIWVEVAQREGHKLEFLARQSNRYPYGLWWSCTNQDCESCADLLSPACSSCPPSGPKNCASRPCTDKRTQAYDEHRSAMHCGDVAAAMRHDAENIAEQWLARQRVYDRMYALDLIVLAGLR